MSAIGKAASLTGAACSIWFEAVTRRNGESRSVRSALRLAHFNAHARIREAPVGSLCERIRKLNGTAPDALRIPAVCIDSGLGTSAFYVALAAVAAARRPRQIVEFGTFLGHGALVLAANAPEALVLTIDLPDTAGDLSNLNNTDQEHVRNSRNRVGQAYRGAECEPRITELKCDSRKLV